MGYAMKNGVAVCLDAGHFHPTEVISNKISSLLLFSNEMLLHVSRPVRWDSDHVVILDDELQEIAFEVVRNGLLPRIHIGLDFFDASINRVAAWVIGTRNMQKALLRAPARAHRPDEAARARWRLHRPPCLPRGAQGPAPGRPCGRNSARRQNVPGGLGWLDEVRAYEKSILESRA